MGTQSFKTRLRNPFFLILTFSCWRSHTWFFLKTNKSAQCVFEGKLDDFFRCCDIALTVFPRKESIGVCTLYIQIKFIGWNTQLRLFCRWIQSPGDTRVTGDHLEVFSPVICTLLTICTLELLNTMWTIENIPVRISYFLISLFLFFSGVQLTCHCTLKKAAAHLAAVPTNWQTTQVTLTVTKIPRCDLDEEQHWHLRALWLTRLTFKNEKQKRVEAWCWAEDTQHNASAPSPE